MAKKILGIEIGNCRIKMALCDGDNLQRMVVAELPDNYVKDDEIVSWDAMADFIKEVVKKEGIGSKNVAMVLPEKLAYTKRITMPVMTVDQLKVNLPYEFKDYITTDKDKYVYDYAVVKMNETDMELMAMAAQKEVIERYRTMMRRAGLKLTLIAPELSAVRNIIKNYEHFNGIDEPKDYAILDIGQSFLGMFFFDAGEYDVTRIMEPGCVELDEYIAEKTDVDVHIARMYKENNKDDILHDEGCAEIYGRIVVEVMRVLNFYNYNHPDNKLETLYCGGGGSHIEPLMKALEQGLDIKVASISELITPDICKDKDTMEKLVTGPKALGITWE